MEKKNFEGSIQLMLLPTPAKVETADISTWVSAVNSYKFGYRQQLYNLLENISTDPFLWDAMDKRISAITNAEITFTDKDGKRVPEIDALIDTIAFEELISEIALTRAWGKSLIELQAVPQFDVYSYPRKHIKVTGMHLPLGQRTKFLAMRESDMSGFDYTNNEYFIECGKDDDMGYLFRAAQYVIYKRGNFGDWAQFAEIFGMPFLTGKYSSADPTSRNLLFEALKSIGSNPIAAIPKETEIQVTPNNSTGSNDLYKGLREACNEEILIAIIGNDMTTINGSSKSQGEVHLEMLHEKNKSDRRYVQRILNSKFVPWLIARGYPANGGTFSFPDKGESLSTETKVKIAIDIKNAGIPIPDNYFYEVSGVRKPENGEEVSSLAPSAPAADAPPAPSNPPAEPPANPPAGPPAPANAVHDEKSFWQRISSFFREALAPRAPLKF